MNWQYCSFFSHLHDILHGEASLVYSFSRAIGGEMLGVFGYYMISPFNLIFYFFDSEHIYVGVLVLILLKSGTCGLAMYHFLQYKKSDVAGLIFSTAYALSAYMIGYQFNIFWIDGVIILPILILGIERLVEEQKYLIYILALAYGLITNFYIGYMLCIFSVLYFLCYFFLISSTDKKISTILMYLSSSLAGGALSSISSLPMLFVLAEGKGTTDFDLIYLIKNKTKLFGYWSVFDKSLLGTISEEQMTAGKPLLYCGILVLLMVICWFLNWKNHWKEKLGYFILVIIIIHSLAFYNLNTIWHGLNVPNGSPYRFSFIYIFLMVYLGYMGFIQVKAGAVQSKWDRLLCLIAGILVLACLFLRKSELSESTREGVVLINALVVCFYMVLFIFNKKGRLCSVLCMVMMSTELVCNAYYLYSYSEAYHGVTTTEYDSYYAQITPLLETIKKDDTFFRTVLLGEAKRTGNDSFMFNIYGLDSYTSVENVNTALLGKKLGLESSIIFGLHYNEGITRASDSLLGVKYFITSEKLDNTYKLIKENNGFYLYENSEALPLVIFADESITEVCDAAENTFQYIEDIYQCINPNEEQELYEIIEMEFVGSNNCKKQDNRYQADEDCEEAWVEYLVSAQAGENLYAKFDDSGAYKTQVCKEGEWKEFTTESDEAIRIRFYMKGGESFYPDKVCIYAEQEETLSSYVNYVQNQSVTIDKKTDARIYIQCENESGKEQYLLCSIPYDDG